MSRVVFIWVAIHNMGTHISVPDRSCSRLPDFALQRGEVGLSGYELS